MSSQDAELLREMLLDRRAKYYQSQVRWSALYHATLYGAPLFAFLTTLAVSIGWSQAWQSVFAAGTTLLASLATAGAFREKWHVNRRSRSAVDVMLIEITDSKHDDVKIKSKLIDLVQRHDELILAAEEGGGEQENGG